MRKVSQQIPAPRTQSDELLADGGADEETREIIERIYEVEGEHRRDLLQVGTAGRLLLNGGIEAMLRLEG